MKHYLFKQTALLFNLSLFILLLSPPAIAKDWSKSSNIEDQVKVKLQSYNVESSLPGKLTKASRQNPLEIQGNLYIPKDADNPPVVLYLLSSGGYSKKYDGGWLKYFRDKNYATFWFDQYTPRGLDLSTGLGKSQAGMTDMSYLSDVFAAISYLRRHPKLKNSKLVTFGSSWGGGIQMYMLSDWYSQIIGGGQTVDGHIAITPYCYLTVDKPTMSSEATRSLVIYGEKDIWTKPKPCQDYVAKLKTSGGLINEHIVKGGNHGLARVQKEKKYRVTTWNCQVTFEPSTMKAFHRRENKTADFNKGWGNVWDDCVGENMVVTGGTKAQRKEVESVIQRHLDLVFGG